MAAVCGLVESVGSGILGIGHPWVLEIKIMQHMELGICILISFDLGLVWSGILGFVETMIKQPVKSVSATQFPFKVQEG